MGGLAFANLTTDDGTAPHVPRLSPSLYQTIAGECQSKLEKLFQRVVIPRDAPAKADYGDIDFLVEGIRPETPRKDIWATIKKALDARLHLARGGSHSYAISHPEITGAYVQVDVELSPGDDTPDGSELFEWTRFMKGDSDLLQIIGVSHRPLGLTCNDQGLHLRVEEIEPYNKKKALVFLTRDPNKAMEFYGLDVTKYWAGFADELELFKWACSGRLFSSAIFESRVEKSNDRSRQTKRPMYRRFVEEYMPAHQEQGATNHWTRRQVLQEALDSFDKHIEYDTMIEEHRLRGVEESLWKDIRAILPVQGSSLGQALKGLRRWVEFQDGLPHIVSEAQREDYSRWSKSITADNRGKVLDWVKDNWAEVKALEKARANSAKEAARAS